MSANLISAVHDLVLESGLGAKNIAAAVGKPYSTLLREVNPFDDGAKLGAETLVDIMRVTGNIQPLEHIAEQFGYELKRTHYATPRTMPPQAQRTTMKHTTALLPRLSGLFHIRSPLPQKVLGKPRIFHRYT